MMRTFLSAISTRRARGRRWSRRLPPGAVGLGLIAFRPAMRSFKAGSSRSAIPSGLLLGSWRDSQSQEHENRLLEAQDIFVVQPPDLRANLRL